jgi:uridine kinase
MADGHTLASVSALMGQVVAARSKVPSHRALLAGISGIDGSGKGFVTAQLVNQLRELGRNVAAVSADDWHNLPRIRRNPEHFYECALRLRQMFEQLVMPLREQRAINMLADFADAKATVYHKQRYSFRDVDIILVEGIFLFKPSFRDYFDLKIWIDCSFVTSLQRAIVRAQEGLSPSETKRAFETVYFPAQRLHLERDQPSKHADVIFDNETLAGDGAAG